MLLPSCDGRTGYLEDNQEAIIDNLAASEWILMREESKIFGTKTYEKESRIYQFDDNGKGWTAWAAMSDGTLLTEPVHFRWAFTTPEFTVFQTTGNSIEALLAHPEAYSIRIPGTVDTARPGAISKPG